MKKIAKFFVFAIAAMAALSACNKLEVNEQISEGSQVLTAFTDNALTKTTLDGTNIVWASTDKVKAFTATGTAFESTQTTVSEEGAKAEFTFGTDSELAYAVYPSTSARTMADGAIDVVIPSSQVATAGSFADGANTAIGAVEENGTIFFKNIGALVSFDIKNDGIKSIMLTATPATAGYGFSGNAKVSLTDGEVSFTKNDGIEDVQLIGDFQKGSTYYMVVYPGTYKDITLTFINADGKAATYTNASTLTLERNANVNIFSQEIADSKWGDGTIVENFSSSKATSNKYGCGSEIATSGNADDFDFTWTPSGSAYVFQNGIRLGTSAKTGSVTSNDILESIDADSNFTVKVYGAQWNTDGGKIAVTYNGKTIATAPVVDPITTPNDVEYSASDFAEPTEFIFKKDANASALTIATSSKRIIIDKVEIVLGGEIEDTPNPDSNVYASLEDLVNAGTPSTEGKEVTVTITNKEITKLAKSGTYTNGIYVMAGSQEVEIYCKDVPATWRVGGKVSGTITCTWKLYNTTWELCPTNWEGFEYVAPPKALEGLSWTEYTKSYVIGETFAIDGTIKALYTDATEKALSASDVTLTVTPDLTKAGATTATISYTEDGKTFTATADITVVEAGNLVVSAVFDKQGVYGITYTSTNKLKGRDTFKVGDYTFAWAGDGTNGCASYDGYILFGKQGAYIETPAIEGYKLIEYTIKTGTGASTSVKAAVQGTDGSAVSGGAEKTLNAKNAEFTYSLTNTTVNTAYRLVVTNSYNAQAQSITLVYTK